MEIFLETYGNTLVMARTSEYISIIAKLLNKFVTQDIKYKCPLHEIVDLRNLLYKEIDEISNILSMWDNNFKFDIQKYRFFTTNTEKIESDINSKTGMTTEII